MKPQRPGSAPLYQQIVESIREDLLAGRLRPGDVLPPVREMAERWGCTPGTVHQAYRELAQQGLAVSRPGQGTRIGAGAHSAPSGLSNAPLRRASLANQAEAFLLEVMSAGYSTAEAETAFRTALDRWRTLSSQVPVARGGALRLAGSHDPAVSLVASRFNELCPGCSMDVAFSGSLGGLIALAEGKADLAGSHLWDATSNTYNAPFIRRLLPGRRVALVTLAHRRLGLLVPPGNPRRLTTLHALAGPGVRFMNRQRGAGTRVWLDAQLQRLAIDPASLAGYASEESTHAEVARAVADGRADAGIGVETVALSYGLDFVFLTREPYDLVIPQESWHLAPIKALVAWLQTEDAGAAIGSLGGYDTASTGRLEWVE